jgi:hypothetical protein
MLRCSAIFCALLALASGMMAAQPEVRVDTSQLQGPRPLEEQTRIAAIRDYLESWQNMSEAFQQNRAGILDADFVGAARDKLGKTIDEQLKLGIRTHYLDRTHEIQVLFYSPEGSSIELIDKVEYNVEVLDHEKPVTSMPASARYIVILTPSEVRWRVRVMQAVSDVAAN